MPDNSTEVCNQGEHYILDDGQNKYVHVGKCSDTHGGDSQDSKQQVVDAAQSAMKAATGNMFPYGDPMKNLKQGLGGQ